MTEPPLPLSSGGHARAGRWPLGSDLDATNMRSEICGSARKCCQGIDSPGSGSTTSVDKLDVEATDRNFTSRGICCGPERCATDGVFPGIAGWTVRVHRVNDPRLFGTPEEGSRVIFSEHEVNTVEDPAASREDHARLQAQITHDAGVVTVAPADEAEMSARLEADRSSAGLAFACLASAVAWLVLGSFAGLVSSIKLHEPDWLVRQAWLTLGRIRPAHLNAVIYGWSSLAGMGIALWLVPRLLRVELVGERYGYFGIAIWNVGVASDFSAF